MTTRMNGKQGLLDALCQDLSRRKQPGQFDRYCELNEAELTGYPFTGRVLGRSEDGSRVVREWRFLMPVYKKRWKARDLAWLLETDRKGELAQYLDMCREVIILEFERAGRESVSLKVDLKPGTEKRHDTLYQITYLNIVKQDLAEIYAEVEGLLWFKGVEPRSPNATVYAHRLIYTWLTGESLYELHIHHQDHDGANNLLPNMEPMSEVDHALLHGDTFDKNRITMAKASVPAHEASANPITSAVSAVAPIEQVHADHNQDARKPVQLSLFSEAELKAVENHAHRSHWFLGPERCRLRRRNAKFRNFTDGQPVAGGRFEHIGPGPPVT